MATNILSLEIPLLTGEEFVAPSGKDYKCQWEKTIDTATDGQLNSAVHIFLWGSSD